MYRDTEVSDIINQAFGIRKNKDYDAIQKILVDNGIPFYVVKTVGMSGEIIEGIQIFQCGINLAKKLEIAKQLLHGEKCKVTASDETINITV